MDIWKDLLLLPPKTEVKTIPVIDDEDACCEQIKGVFFSRLSIQDSETGETSKDMECILFQRLLEEMSQDTHYSSEMNKWAKSLLEEWDECENDTGWKSKLR
tara:strand:- start:590 stop:895 length:306 start_codon:yes stop_codon:yes gene_type:complete